MGGDERGREIGAYTQGERRGLILRLCFAHTRAHNLHQEDDMQLEQLEQLEMLGFLGNQS